MSGAQSQVADLLSRLVAFDTTSHKSNTALISFVADYLRGHGVSSSLVKNAEGTKANLFATIGPCDSTRPRGGIALSGHTDVVPVTGQAWDTDPFTLTERDGKFYGRGTSDMKGFLACVLAAVPRFAARSLKTPIHIAFSYDEEIGCIGVRPMLAELGGRFPKPAMVIVGEPTSMTVVDAHKGPVRWVVDVTGRAAHSSMAPLGVNAITYAARILNELLGIESELKREPINLRFDPPYVTLQTTRIDGGMATNIVPAHCSFMFDIRALPDFDISTIEQRLRLFIETACLPEMKAIAPEADVRISRANQVPPFSSAANSAVVALALQLARQNETFAVSYATEAGLFQDAGTPAVVCGPGDIAQAHTANEWIEITQLQACSEFLERLGDWAAETAWPQSNS